ncbi:syntaxin-12 [Anthonomus grandis grandis]|uniref:syntaxin-12 n=1 Tax=Anthonomus grandis grandis TaxID=2921223 RepID=UPI0021657DF2|nr:syntaxin-12 [Anthonomus grandis grandis]
MMSRKPNYGSITDPEVGYSGLPPNSETYTEFNSLCDDIATNLYTINSSINILQENLKLIGSARDNVGIRNKIHITQLSANQVASRCTKDISKLKLKLSTKALKNDKQRKLQADKLDEDFRDTVNKYYALQKQLADKQKANLLLTQTVEHTPSDDDDQENDAQQKQSQLTRELQFEQELMLEREERIKQIESDMLDINQIMRELGAVVHEQGDTIATIESQIDHAAGSVTEGAGQLKSAAGYQNKYRKKLLVLVIIATIIAVILISVLVTQLKK